MPESAAARREHHDRGANNVLFDRLVAVREAAGICASLGGAERLALERLGFTPEPECPARWQRAGGGQAIFVDLDAAPCCGDLPPVLPETLVILHDLPLARRRLGRLREMLRVAIRNRRLMRRLNERGPSVSPLVDLHGTLLIPGENGYWSNKNPFSRGERLRRLIYRRPWLTLLADRRLVLSGCADPVANVRQAIERVAGAGRQRLLSALLLQNKLVVMTQGTDGCGWVGILPGDEVGRFSRRREIEILDWLRTHPEFAGRLPEVARCVQHGDEEIFVQSRLPGMTVDVPFPGLDGLFAQAADFLAATRHVGSGPEAAWPALEEDLDIFARRFPAAARRLVHGWADSGQAWLARVGTSWYHGDAKLENFVFSWPGEPRLVGMIDFETARRSAPAGWDALCLHLNRWYIEHLQPGQSEVWRFLKAMEQLLSGDFRNRFRPWFSQIADRDLRILLERLVVNHFSRRYHIPRPTPRQQEEMGEILALIARCVPGEPK